MCCEPPILSEAVSLEQPVVRCRWPAKQRLSDADGTAPEQYTAVDVTAALARPRTTSELDACVSSHDDENSADNCRAPLPKRARPGVRLGVSRSWSLARLYSSCQTKCGSYSRVQQPIVGYAYRCPTLAITHNTSYPRCKCTASIV